MGNEHKLKVLVVEDSYIDKIIIKEAFRSEYRIFSANNGMEGLEILENNPDIAIVLTDLEMPIMNGFELIRKAKSTPGISEIPIVVVTSSDDVESQIKALDLGAYDVLFKPLNTQLVIHRVRNIMTALAAGSNKSDSEVVYQKVIQRNDIDEITGIYTRKKFIEEASRLIRSNHDKTYYLLRFDVDGFKVLNDACGLAEGDRLLEWIGSECINMAEPGVVYGHWEADHFVVCMEAECFERQNIPELCSRNFEYDNPNFNVSLRLGIYKIYDTSVDIQIMVDRAYMALRSVKGNYSRHYAYFDESMRQKIMEESRIVNECEDALKNGQFIIYFQPQINYMNGSLHGAEALVRWMRSEDEIISPGKFIPIFEKNGFISKLDQYVWEQVVKYQKKWTDEGIDILPVSVNVSRVDISNPKIFEDLEDMLALYRLPKECIRLEITESAYMDNPQLLINSVKRLQESGFQIEMDDFGSGYSSLNTLKDVPVDMLKLDMKFMQDGENANRGGSILSSVIRMSNWLKLPVIAEGVETKNQADYLKSIGCVYMQGYYFSRPIPVNEYEVMLKTKVCEKYKDKRFYDDMENAYQYLNANTSATFVFNCFVGGAAIVEYDVNSLEVIRINDRFYQTFGIANNDYINRKVNLFDAFDGENRRKLVAALDAAQEKKQECSCELKVYGRDGQDDIWCRVRVRLLAVNVDKLLYYIAVDDITDNVNLLEDKKQMAQQMYTIINSVPCGIVDLEKKKEDISMIYFNDQICRMLGYERDECEELFSENPYNAVHPEDVEVFHSMTMSKIQRNENNISTFVRLKCKDGSYKKVIFSGGITRQNEQAVYVTAVIYE